MAKRIIWTERFNKSLEYILTCAQDIYTNNTRRKLKAGIRHCESIIADNPLLGSIERNLEGLDYEYRYFLIRPCFKIIYRNNKDCIIFMEIWDTRRDPSFLTYNYKILNF